MPYQLASLSDRIRDNILIAITICYISGAALAAYRPLAPHLIIPFITVLLVILLLLLFFHSKPITSSLLLPLFLFIGFIHTSNSFLPPGDSAHLYTLLPERSEVTLTGRVLNMPEYDGQKTRFDLDVDSIRTRADHLGQTGLREAHGKIRISLEDTLPPAIVPGDRLMILASAARIQNYRTPGVFDYRLYMAEQDIFVSAKVHKTKDIIPFQDISQCWYTGFLTIPERLRYRIGIFLQNHLEPKAAGIYQALLIGSRAGIDEATQEQFKASGCMHLLAISGIHMSLLGLMVTVALTWLLKRSPWLLLNTHVPTIATVATLLPLTAYAFVAGLNTPVLRSLIMACLFLIGVVLQRQRSILHIIAAAALIMLVWRPLALFSVSFQLSFSSILAIALLYPRLLNSWEQNTGSVAKQFHTYCLSALLVSLAATLGALPFMLLHFNRFSVVGPLLNLAVEPFLCLWALPLGLLALPLIPVAPAGAVLLLKIGALGITAADKITLAGSSIPFASLWTITPSAGEIMLYFLLFLLWMTCSGSIRSKTILTTCSILLVLFFTRGIWFTAPSLQAELSFLDVGQGSSTLALLPSGRKVLIDGGGTTSPSFHIGERIISPFLRKKGLWKINDIILTHPHTDHTNGIDFILRHFRPERLWINGDGKDEWPMRMLLRLAAEKKIQVLEPGTGETVELGKHTRLIFLQGAGSIRPGSSVNDRSLVTRLDHGEVSFLFPGDIGQQREKILVENNTQLKADLLLAPHHASRDSGSDEFIKNVAPRIIIVSAGRNARNRNLDHEHLVQWRNEGRQVLLTGNFGTITCRSDGTNLQVQTAPYNGLYSEKVRSDRQQDPPGFTPR